MNISAVTIHNSCKKIAQLNRVIEYLQSFLEELVFQNAELRKQYDSQFHFLSQSHEQKLNSIIDSVIQQNSEVYEETVKFYQYRSKRDFGSELQQLRENIQKDEIAIIDEAKNLQAVIFMITNNIQKEIEILKEENHVKDMQAKSKELEKKRKLKIREIDKEHHDKLNELTMNTKRSFDEIREHHEKVKKDIIITYEKQQNIPQKSINHIKELKNQAKSVKESIQALRKSVKHEQTISSQNFIGFRTRLKSLINDIQNKQKENCEKSDKMKNEHDQIYKKLKIELKEQKNSRISQTNSFENEITLLKNEQKISKSQSKALLTQLQKRISNHSSSLEIEINEEIKNFQQEIDNAMLSFNNDKNEFENKLEQNRLNIENKKKEFSEKEAKVNQTKNDLLKTFQDEVDLFKSQSKQEKEEENENFKTNMDNTQNEINSQIHNSEKSTQLCNDILDYREQLETIKKEFQLKLSEIEEEENSLKEQYEKEYNDMKKVFDNEYELKQEQINKSQEDEINKLSIKENQAKQQVDANYIEGINQIKELYSESSFKHKNEEYELEYENLSKELNLISNSQNEVKCNENTVNEFEQKKHNVKESISSDRFSLIEKYRKEENEINSAMPILLTPDSISLKSDELDHLKKKYSKVFLMLDKEIEKHKGILSELENEHSKILKNTFQSSDQTLDNLKASLSLLKKANEDQIESEKNRMKSIINQLQKEIEQEIQKVKAKYEEEEKLNDEDHKKFRDLFQIQMDRRKLMNKQFDDQINDEIKSFEGLKRSKLNQFDVLTQKLNDDIISLRNNFINGIQSNGLLSLKSEADALTKSLQEQLDGVTQQIEEEMKQLNELRNTTIKQSETEMKEMTTKRDLLVFNFTQRPMRNEEKSVIDNLTKVVDSLTEQLKKIGMEYLDIREGLRIREKEFTQRFGNRPEVLESRNQRKRGTTASAFARKKPLPPLGRTSPICAY